MKKERVVEFDIARGIAVIGMVLVHVYMGLCNVNSEWFYYFCYIPGTPFAAPVFMILLGANLVLAKKSDPSQITKRFKKMAVIAIVYTVAGYAMPLAIYAFMKNDMGYLNMALDSLMTVDILQFAAMAMLFFAICTKLGIDDFMMVFMAVVLQILRYTFNGEITVQKDSVILEWMYRLFVGSPNKSYFPFVCWILFPIAGKIFAEKRIETENKNKFYTKALLTSGIVCVIGIALNFYLNEKIGLAISFGSTEGYEQMHLLGNMIFISFAIMWISICYFSLSVIPKGLSMILYTLSRNTTVIYCLHFPIIRYILVLVCDNEPPMGIVATLLMTLLLLIEGCICAELIRKLKKMSVRD